MPRAARRGNSDEKKPQQANARSKKPAAAAEERAASEVHQRSERGSPLSASRLIARYTTVEPTGHGTLT